MKKTILLYTAFLIAIATLFAQTPDTFKYQVVVRNASGNVIANQQVSITIIVSQSITGGTSLYTETHNLTTNEVGLVNLTIGTENPTGFAAIDWNKGPHFLKTEMDGTLVEINRLISAHSIDVFPPGRLILWNKLGSTSEVQNSETGPDGTIIGTVNYNNDVKFGKGICPNRGRAGSGIDFPTTIANPEKGCIEMWAEFYHTPTAYSHGVYGFVNVAHWHHNPVSLYWHNSNNTLGFTIDFNSTIFSATYENFAPDLDKPIHIACVWDRNGIDGSGDYLRIYIDGVVVATNNSDNAWGTDNTTGYFRVAAPWDSRFTTDRYAVDNIKVWNYAKADFSDRFSE